MYNYKKKNIKIGRVVSEERDYKHRYKRFLYKKIRCDNFDDTTSCYNKWVKIEFYVNDVIWKQTRGSRNKPLKMWTRLKRRQQYANGLCLRWLSLPANRLYYHSWPLCAELPKCFVLLKRLRWRWNCRENWSLPLEQVDVVIANVSRFICVLKKVRLNKKLKCILLNLFVLYEVLL